MTTTFRLLAVALLLGATASAQTTATQDVTVVVEDVSALTVSGDPGTITLTPTTASTVTGTDNTTTYSVATNGDNTNQKKITAQLDQIYATGIDLAVNLTAPSGNSSAASSAGSVTLTAAPQDLVSNIYGLDENSLGIAYTASATFSANPNGAGETRTVTFTLTDN
jgi:hypothetical protein